MSLFHPGNRKRVWLKMTLTTPHPRLGLGKRRGRCCRRSERANSQWKEALGMKGFPRKLSPVSQIRSTRLLGSPVPQHRPKTAFPKQERFSWLLTATAVTGGRAELV